MIMRFLDEEKKDVGISAGINTSESADLIMSGLLGACVMYTSDKSITHLDSTIAALISFLKSMEIQK